MKKLLSIIILLMATISYYYTSLRANTSFTTTANTIQMDSTDSVKKDSTEQVISTDWESVEEVKPAKPIPTDIFRQSKGTYASLKQRIRARQQYYQALADSTISPQMLDSARQEITHFLLQEIMPFWYGTEWDFNGYTAVPNQGEVACGYLVSTTMRDVGFKLNRYHMAQQASYHAAISLQKKAAIRIYRERSVESLKATLIYQEKQKDGLYFIGLDNHVGFLLIHHQELYFIHSNYITDKVMIEHVDDSFAFSSSIYVIADITYNDALIGKWIKGETVKIVRG